MLLVSSTLESILSTPADRQRLLRPVALAGTLWLVIAGLLGLITIYVLLVVPVAGLVFAIVTALFTTFGYGLISRHGLGFPVVSMTLASGAA